MNFWTDLHNSCSWFSVKLSLRSDSRPLSFLSQPMCVTAVVLIAYRVICSEGRSATGVLTCSWKEVPSNVGVASRNSAGIPQIRCQPSRCSQGWARAAVTACRRAARHNPQEMIRDEMSLTSSPTSLRRRANPTQPLLIPAWWTSRACSFARVDGGWFSVRKKKIGRKRENWRVNVWLRILVLHLLLNAASTIHRTWFIH